MTDDDERRRRSLAARPVRFVLGGIEYVLSIDEARDVLRRIIQAFPAGHAPSLAAGALGRIVTPAKVAASRANGLRRSLPCASPSCGHSQRAHRKRGGCECGCPGYQRPE